MLLHLVQHGEANEPEVDPERHLSDRGRRDVGRVAAFLKPLGLTVEAVWHSGKARAVETAELLMESVHAVQGLRDFGGLSPGDAVEPVAEDIEEFAGDLMIVGHMPFLRKLAALLLTGDTGTQTVAFRRGGVVCLEGGAGQQWRIRWMIVPELLEDAIDLADPDPG